MFIYLNEVFELMSYVSAKMHKLSTVVDVGSKNKNLYNIKS